MPCRAVVAQHLLQLVGGAIEAVLGRVVLAVQRLEDARGPVQQRLGVRQPGVLGLQRIPFVRTQPQAVQFVRLPLQAVAFGGQRLGVLLGGIELAGQRAPLLPGLRHRLAQFGVPAVGVEQVALGLGAHQALVGVLAVDVDQSVAELAQLGDRGRHAVDVGAAAAGCR